MKRILFFLAICLCTGMAYAQKKQPTLEEVVRGRFYANSFGSVTPIPGDADHYAQGGGRGTRVVKYDFRTGQEAGVLFDAAGSELSRFDGFRFSPDGRWLLLWTRTHRIYRRSFTADFYLYRLSDGTLRKLSEAGAQQAPVFAPDGSKVAFVRQNNIFVVDTADGSERQVTTDGRFNEVIYGLPDWVYEEEFAMTTAMDFSADGQTLAFLRFDESKVKSYSMPLYMGDKPAMKQYAKYPGDYTYKYPKTGEDNSVVTLLAYDVPTGATRTMNVPVDADGYIPRIRFTKDGGKLAVLTLNRDQNQLDLYLCEPKKSGDCRLVLRDASKAYIKEEVLDNIRFYPGHFSWMSDRDGFMHLYWYTLDGKLERQLTSGRYEVSSFLGYDGRNFYYQSNERGVTQQQVYRVDKKGRKACLTDRQGMNTATFGSDMKYFLNKHTSLNQPNVFSLCNADGQVLKVVEDNHELLQTLAGYDMPQKEFFTFTTSEGVQLNGYLMKPTGFRADQKYPVLLTQYSGPGSQNVLDSYEVSWETFMATQGFLVVCVDGRSTGGRGADFEKCTYLELGVREARDQVETALYVGTLPYADKDNIGIWGWSYGGYCTLMSMSEGRPVFKAGVAVAPVTDWNYYDTIYGERYMRTPQKNPEGYKASSALYRADKLHGALLLVHGMADDNVHYQNTAEYAEILVQAGKPFDMAVYTNRNHSIYGGNTRMHLYQKLTHFFQTQLQGHGE